MVRNSKSCLSKDSATVNAVGGSMTARELVGGRGLYKGMRKRIGRWIRMG